MKKAWIHVLKNLFIYSTLLYFSFFLNIAYAVPVYPFNVVKKAGTVLPTNILPHTTIQAYYTVTNNTLEQRNNNFVKYLPPNTTQVTSGGTYPNTCGPTFNLTPRGTATDSCTLQLAVSGPINGNDPNPHHHLFVCFPAGLTCAGTVNSLNVTQLASLTISTTGSSDIGTGETQQFTATATFPSGRTQNVTTTVTWISSDTNVATITSGASGGLATGISVGSTNISANFGGVISNILTLNVHSYLYIVNDQLNVLICSLNPAGLIDPGACLTNTLVTNPAGIALNPAHTFAYVSSQVNNAVSVCAINSMTGDLTSCNNAGPVFSSPLAIAIHPNNIFAYVVDNNGVNRCLIDSLSGMLSSCSTTGTSFDLPVGITIANAGTFANITNFNGNSVTTCTINTSSGALFGCSVNPFFFNTPFGDAINPAGTFLYVVETGGVLKAVNHAGVNPSTGVLTSSNSQASPIFPAPRFIAVDLAFQHAYITNFTSGTLVKCDINPGSGAFATCFSITSATIPLVTPFGVAIQR